ncbi:MAG: hypothetical protein ACE1S7_02720 [Candidatus Tisiphia sp.]
MLEFLDRIHNLETLGEKSLEKAKKIVEETVIHFLTLAMHLKIPTVTKRIITLCCQHLSISLHKAFVDNSQSLSPTFQNEISQMQNLCRLEAI